MFENFQKAVRDSYLDLKKNRQLGFSREWPSAGDLKNWSIQCFEKGLSEADEIVFTDYFREKDEKKLQKQLGKSLREIVKDSDTDKFRALRNFIIGDTKRSPDRDVVKFLAVLINFQPRPYDFNYRNEVQTDGAAPIDDADINDDTYTCPSKDNGDELVYDKSSDHLGVDINDINELASDIPPDHPQGSLFPEETCSVSIFEYKPDIIPTKSEDQIEDIIGSSDSKNENSENLETEEIRPVSDIINSDEIILDNNNKGNASQQNDPRSFFTKNKLVLRFSGVALLVLAILTTVHFLTPEECMCWNGEKYIEVDCQSKTQPYQVIGLDKNKLEGFVKITRPDTLGPKDVGRVWYSKINHEVEFFTGPGYHPTEFGRSLKAATMRILDSYAGANAKSDQNKKYGIMQKQ
ncbi:hypothetical protein HS960_14460 [Sphingobacterium paramultivorum]|uniref:Uncharacterized protein n=1 Tax=Sphingobacterium paramultivorum TaxID=2886510 RepID=A0A7G5E459_9SPHI|nr:hypothetical protein [Sphingobacterium paramultivorum]QMV68784.1 hypothetical protein HS960_14460 [Sphingobacterium paramultivorum]WSO12548.1 hypothetical protein VUL84_14450 [Sphingobacterium paramultivorum]